MSETQHDDVEFEGVIKQSSAKAILFQGDLWDEPEWIPRSQCTIVPQPGEDEGKAVLYIRAWLVKKNGWNS